MSESTRVTYLVDHTTMDVIVGDLLPAEDQSEGDTPRPHLLLLIDPMSRLIVGSFFSTGETDEQAVSVPMRSPGHAPAESESIESG